jgi:hypothetical protein
VKMPRGPKGEKRPADVIGNAIKVAKIATGEKVDEKTDDGKDKAAVHANSNKETANDPNLAGRTSTASADHRPTSGETTSMPVEPRQGGGT